MSYARAGSSPAFGTIHLRFLKLTYIDSQVFLHDLRVCGKRRKRGSVGIFFNELLSRSSCLAILYVQAYHLSTSLPFLPLQTPFADEFKYLNRLINKYSY